MLSLLIIVLAAALVLLAGAMVNHRDLKRAHAEVLGTLEVNTKILNDVACRDHVDSRLRHRIEATIVDNVSITSDNRRRFNFEDV